MTMTIRTFILAVGVATVLHAQSAPSPIQILPVRGNIYMLLGAGGNITVSIGRDGVLLVDSGLAQSADQVLQALRTIQNELDLRDQPVTSGAETRSSIASRNSEPPAKPIRYIINTHVHPDHAGGH